eukprot:GHVN01082161.1.p1 GENE.GHVN01082161.1~~GHVN01082161.1.p1  ORF type:complete len:341 (+),score=104.32 GHVN01082161.1:97-1119(+)
MHSHSSQPRSSRQLNYSHHSSSSSLLPHSAVRNYLLGLDQHDASDPQLSRHNSRHSLPPNSSSSLVADLSLSIDVPTPIAEPKLLTLPLVSEPVCRYAPSTLESLVSEVPISQTGGIEGVDLAAHRLSEVRVVVQPNPTQQVQSSHSSQPPQSAQPPHSTRLGHGVDSRDEWLLRQVLGDKFHLLAQPPMSPYSSHANHSALTPTSLSRPPGHAHTKAAELTGPNSPTSTVTPKSSQTAPPHPSHPARPPRSAHSPHPAQFGSSRGPINPLHPSVSHSTGSATKILSSPTLMNFEIPKSSDSDTRQIYEMLRAVDNTFRVNLQSLTHPLKPKVKVVKVSR